MPLPNGTVFKLDLRMANQIAAGLRVFQAIRANGGWFKELDGSHVHIDRIDHFEDTAQLSDEEVNELVDAIYNGSVLDIPVAVEG